METRIGPPAPVSQNRPGAALEGALARLEARWGSAAIRLGTGGRAERRPGPPVEGALALAPQGEPVTVPGGSLTGLPARPDEVISTGFPALDAALGPGGLPRGTTAVFRGGASSGKTTLALRTLAEAQASGALAAWLDVGRTFDPLEAVARGVDLRWLVVLRPADLEEGLRLAGALLAGRAVDLLAVDLPAHLEANQVALLRRLTAHARRLGARLLLLEPAPSRESLDGRLSEVAGLRLELARQDWIRLGRDVIGQRTSVVVAKNRFGPPGRRIELAIQYAFEGDQTADPGRLLDHGPPGLPPAASTPPLDRPWTSGSDAPSAPRLASSPTPPRSRAAAPATRPADPRRAALAGGRRARREPRRATAGGAPWAAPGERP
jgi:recombination protein RecA